MPTVQRERLTVVHGDGAWLTTSTGDRLLDGTAGLWHANIGHGRQRLADAARAQMTSLETYHVFGRSANEPALRLADRLAEMVPVAGSKIFLTSGGSDSIEAACKLARLHWQLEGRPQKRIVVSRERAYHGLHAFGTSIGGLTYNRTGYGTSSLVPECARIPTHGLDGAIEVMEQIGCENIAAIITEPVLGTGGVHGPEQGYLEGLEEFARANDILLIIDEVITGFGRTGRMFASERWQLSPDIMTMAKGITSGYAPLGGIAVAPRVADRFFTGKDAPIFRHGLTYSGHATACAVAEANIDVIVDEALVTRAAKLEEVLVSEVGSLRTHPLVREVRAGCGLLAGVELNADADAAAVADLCSESGLMTRVIHGNTLQISPPFVVTEPEIELLAATMRSALDHYSTARVAPVIPEVSDFQKGALCSRKT
ncbi:aminotransferase family protein [Saccharopolyspora mangrovi]|uniref:Aminotransferase class III-fold pyridoxal phosphate-dependent enzyme n=1 Tax=Saccharopolyspora mangrovi TaxID=3082379 RepID=A0ABU6AG46_9PSEU|nr:aminotransferase class III-fold pyridoxal phosphate-dependent enzyme [Saccharopolyspora sp. S2-29]MEB3370506.1 aminotransferase class III-fold pyridoxal phosphate-dependent enzyme [Saccharopolyspora sp. S2-29]